MGYEWQYFDPQIPRSYFDMLENGMFLAIESSKMFLYSNMELGFVMAEVTKVSNVRIYVH
jgi:hypothetical protein